VDRVEQLIRAGEVVDLHRAVSVPVPLRGIAKLLGVPERDHPYLSNLVPRMINVVDPTAGPEAIADADEAFGELAEYIVRLVAARRTSLQDDLISALVTVREEDDQRLSDDELSNMLFTLWAAGFETAATAIDMAVLAAMEHPDQTHWLSDPAGATFFVDEVLRWDPPGQISTSFRFAAEDVGMSGVLLPRGAQVRLLLGAANRDPESCEDPDRFEPGRRASASLAFGTGIHYCLGSRLARLEMAVVVSTLFTRLPGLCLAGAPVRRRSMPLRDFESFHVTLSRDRVA
jgi:cytochrome P450